MKSYFLKTVVLLEIDSRSHDFWNKPLSYIFMAVSKMNTKRCRYVLIFYLQLLQSYSDRLSQRNIPFYWNNRYNLIEKLNSNTIDNINNRIKAIMKNVTTHTTDPNVIFTYLRKYIIWLFLPSNYMMRGTQIRWHSPSFLIAAFSSNSEDFRISSFAVWVDNFRLPMVF